MNKRHSQSVLTKCKNEFPFLATGSLVEIWVAELLHTARDQNSTPKTNTQADLSVLYTAFRTNTYTNTSDVQNVEPVKRSFRLRSR